MLKTFKITFDDLTEEAQDELMKMAEISHPSDANWDIPGCPLAFIDIEVDERKEEE